VARGRVFLGIFPGFASLRLGKPKRPGISHTEQHNPRIRYNRIPEPVHYRLDRQGLHPKTGRNGKYRFTLQLWRVRPFVGLGKRVLGRKPAKGAQPIHDPRGTSRRLGTRSARPMIEVLLLLTAAADEAEERYTLVSIDRTSGRIIGSSRYCNLEPAKREVEIGWTFLQREFWGGRYNGELKSLMLDHAFRFVERVVFVVGENNLRSQKALEKIGARFLERSEARFPDGRVRRNVIFAIDRR